MIGERDRLITVASLVLGLSGVVLGLLSLVAILWLPYGEDDVVQLPAAAPDAAQRGVSSSEAPPPMVVGPAESTPAGGDALKAAPEILMANRPPLRTEPPATSAGNSEPGAGAGTRAEVSEDLGPSLSKAPDEPESPEPDWKPAGIPPGEVPGKDQGKDHQPVASEEAPRTVAPGPSGEVQNAGMGPIASDEESPVVTPESSGEVRPVPVTGDIEAKRQGVAEHPAGKVGAGEAVQEALPGARPPGASAPEKVRDAGPDKAVQADASLRTSRWILDQNPRRYTIQIMAVKDLGHLRRFARHDKLGLVLAYYPVTRKGQRWYILIGGSFDGRKAAARGLKRLPRSVRRNSPWIRSMESVQKEIRRSEG